MPQTNQAPKPNPKGKLASLIGVGAASLLAATVAQWEGYRPTPYVDLAGHKTVCWGDTKDVRMGVTETRAQCVARLERQLLAHVEPVLRCVPQLRGRDNQTAAAASLAYNIGVNAFCNSSAARHFRAGQWREGCDKFLLWNKARINGKLRPVQGLTNRRVAERNICLRGI